VKAKEGVCKEVVEGSPRTVPSVSQLSVRPVARDSVFFPLSDIGGRDVLMTL
jgi:hypothetical protein